MSSGNAEPRRWRARILLVEDEEPLVDALRDLLRSEDYEVLSAGSLEAARRVLAQSELELMLLDLTLPDGSGLELLEGRTGAIQGPTVIVLTADDSIATSVKAIKSGAYDYLAKPFDVEALLHRMKNALEHRLLSSELFGHERGAFTGAGERRRGLFELARRGTLFLDEVAEMPLDAQAVFLRVLETGCFRRLGGSVELATNARVIAASNMDLEKLEAERRFRRDLLFRLNAVELVVPPLRERPEDCRALAEHFCARIASRMGAEARLTGNAHAALMAYAWPGNVRELKNVIERSVMLCGGGEIAAGHLDLRPAAGHPRPDVPEPLTEEAFPTLEEVEKAHIGRALELTGGNRSHAARLLGVARSTLLRKLG